MLEFNGPVVVGPLNKETPTLEAAVEDCEMGIEAAKIGIELVSSWKLC